MSITVGQTLFKPVRNKREIEKVTVTKVGKKYFYTDYNRKHRVHLSNLRYIDPIYPQYSYKLYESEDEMLDIREHTDLVNSLRLRLNRVNLNEFTLAKLKRIDAALLGEDI